VIGWPSRRAVIQADLPGTPVALVDGSWGIRQGRPGGAGCRILLPGRALPWEQAEAEGVIETTSGSQQWYEVSRIEAPGTVLGHLEAPYLTTALQVAVRLWGGRAEDYALRPVRRPPGWGRR